VLGWIFKNRRGDVANKFEFNGKIQHPESCNWDAFVYPFENVFSKDLTHTLEGGMKASTPACSAQAFRNPALHEVPQADYLTQVSEKAILMNI
jgi:hypothetical protein